MDRIEYQEKIKEIRNLADQEKYAEAAAIIEEINWKRVKSATSLCFVGSVLGKAGKYDEGKEILLMAYDRSPIGRTIIYELAELCIREGTLGEAEDYYQEFVEAAPRDSKRYELRYAIDKARGASAEDLIAVLESLKERDFSDKWSYELARMYYKAGRAEQCIELCDEIILWFGDGEYVERALELKMLYQPLTGSQKKLYEDLKLQKEGYVRVSPEDIKESGEIITHEVTIPEVRTDMNKYNTVNLQAEIAKSMEQIMAATEKETVTSAMDDIRKMVAESQIPMLEKVETPDKMYDHIETDEEIDNTMNLNFKMLLSEEQDGQMNLFPTGDSDPMVDQQITGQLSIDDILAEWEKTKHAAETAMEEAKAKRLESAKARALVETGNIMDKIAEVEAYAAEMNDISAGEANTKVASDVADIMQKAEAKEDLGQTIRIPSDVQEILQEAELPTDVQEILQDVNEDSYFDDDLPDEEELEEEDAPTEAEAIADAKLAERQKQEKAHKWDTMSLEFLTKEEEEIFSYFIPVEGMEKQICAVLQGVKSRKLDGTSNAGNILIEGAVRSGKTVLATDLIKVLQTNDPDNVAKVGRISGDKLNDKDVDHIINTIKGGYLIIERAGKMTEDTAYRLSTALSRDTDNLLVLMEDNRKGILEIGEKCKPLVEKFTEHIEIPIFTTDELVNFGKSYAKEQGYGFDQMSILALYKSIANIRDINESTTLTEVMEIINTAIENEKKHKLSKKVDEDNLIILKEKDFPL